MPRIPDEWIERIKHEVLVEDLAKRTGVELRRVGQELVGRCPFPPHEDSTPSLSINPARNVFQCFGCAVAGTAIDWVKQERGVGFREAVEWLLWEFFPSAARELLGERPERERASKLTRRSRAPELPCPFDLFAAEEQTTLNEYVDSCAVLFAQRAEGQEYARKRGLTSSEMAAKFRFGYQDRSLGLMLPTNGTKEGREIRERFKSLGLLRESGHAHFVGSFLVPTIDLLGNVTGIYGRKTRDDLNARSSPKHLYLPGRDDDVFNEEAFVASKEIVLCESRIDALSFWQHDVRNVTACRGAGSLSQALLAAFLRHGVTRCLIAFDHDEAGDKGAQKAAEKLMAAGIECYRVRFPKGMDANEVSLKMTPAAKTLALFLRSAEWMGGHKAQAPSSAARAPEGEHEPERDDVGCEKAALASGPGPASEAAPGPSEATEESHVERPSGREAGLSFGATEEGISIERASARASHARASQAIASQAITPSVEPGLMRSPAAPAPCASTPPVTPVPQTSQPATHTQTPPELVIGAASGLVKLTDDEAELVFEDRRYRVRGLRRCNGYGALKVNLKAERQGIAFEPHSPIAGWHMDNLDLCAHRQRQIFERTASHELGVKEELVRFDLGRILRVLEAVQEQRIAEAQKPKVKTVTLSEKETEEAVAFWKSPDLFARIAEDYTGCGLVGEAVNKIATYIGATSRLLERPLAIIIQSSSAAGKSTLMEKTLAFMPKR